MGSSPPVILLLVCSFTVGMGICNGRFADIERGWLMLFSVLAVVTAVLAARRPLSTLEIPQHRNADNHSIALAAIGVGMPYVVLLSITTALVFGLLQHDRVRPVKCIVDAFAATAALATLIGVVLAVLGARDTNQVAKDTREIAATLRSDYDKFLSVYDDRSVEAEMLRFYLGGDYVFSGVKSWHLDTSVLALIRNSQWRPKLLWFVGRFKITLAENPAEFWSPENKEEIARLLRAYGRKSLASNGVKAHAIAVGDQSEAGFMPFAYRRISGQSDGLLLVRMLRGRKQLTRFDTGSGDSESERAFIETVRLHYMEDLLRRREQFRDLGRWQSAVASYYALAKRHRVLRQHVVDVDELVVLMGAYLRVAEPGLVTATALAARILAQTADAHGRGEDNAFTVLPDVKDEFAGLLASTFAASGL
jgi:hypothetical protein